MVYKVIKKSIYRLIKMDSIILKSSFPVKQLKHFIQDYNKYWETVKLKENH